MLMFCVNYSSVYKLNVKCLFLVLFSLCSAAGFAQSTTGLTGLKDTSYTTWSAYKSTVKTHPHIQIALPVSSATITENRDLVYKAIDARKLRLDAFHPATKAGEKRVAVIFIHGGGWRSGNKEQHHPVAQRLAALGYVCFTPEYRLSTEALYPAAIHDLKEAIQWVRAQATTFGIDTGKVVVAGFSAGGTLAALLGTTNGQKVFETFPNTLQTSSRANAIIDIDGTLSFVHPDSGEGDDRKKTSAATYWFGWSKKENETLWWQASPLTHVSAATPPTLFINSSVARMHAGRDDFTKVLRQFGIYYKVKTFEDAPHSFPLFHPWFEPTVRAMDTFLKKIFAPDVNVSKPF